ncbi:hypothetical protein EFR84_12780 [Rhizobium chutanense]|uniref:Uncharacterized protein n=1 Tax=Rhizobium chutanense TaxID=2035448 RepID=A0A432P3C6_9HYPH|nr:hypothetical protein EFR84_12780 [Rhizobium chutanense]
MPNGSACTTASLFPKRSCWWTSTGSRRFQRSELRRASGQAQRVCPCRRRRSSPGRSIPADAITPLLDGVGPMTIVSLMHNGLFAASMLRGLGVPQLRQM